MEEYLSSVILGIGNGDNYVEISDIMSVTEIEAEYGRELKLMSGAHTVGVRPSYKLEIEYVRPKLHPYNNFSKLAKAVLTLYYENGSTTIYSGVSILKMGNIKYDGENAAVQIITVHANKKVLATLSDKGTWSERDEFLPRRTLERKPDPLLIKV